ncbi:MAG TPA: MarR family transcriptional regulator, partial [Candidatus Cybelea sp.]|nr:MarR family transcriptional regulator [Candidatus Cybelea sp.]
MTERELLERTERLLAELLERPIHTTAPREALDATWATGEHVFLVEAKTSAHSMAHIEQGVRRLQSAADRHPGVIPLLVVPTMGPAGVRLAKEAGISWIDAGGKADIAAPGLRILIKHGNNASPPRKSGTFSPRASNLVHVLLLKPKVEHTASELAHAARLDNGYVTRILDALVEEGYIVEQRRGRQRRIHVAEPNALLTAWDEHYKRPQPFAYALLATRDGFATE